MCTRYLLLRSVEQLAAATGVARFPHLSPRYNAAPGQPLPVVRRRGGKREASLLRWGLVPAWADRPRTAAPLVNARAESAADKPAFREPFRSRRCLVPADGFYEWQPTPHGPMPWLFQPVDDSLLCFAGLWETWTAPGAQPLETFAILTTAPNALVAPIHHRMPAILAPDSYDAWLDADTPSQRLQPLLVACAPSLLRARAVHPRLNHVAHDDPDCLAPPPPTPAYQLDLEF
jgi:putative SOS response-associated peptidase YedK